jgi:hypothetical protein
LILPHPLTVSKGEGRVWESKLRQMKNLTLYCAIPHRPGIDTIEHGDWGLDYEGQQYIHEKYRETSPGKYFFDKIKDLLPEGYENKFDYPTGQNSQAISLNLHQEDFTQDNWLKVLELMREQWPKTTTALSL